MTLDELEDRELPELQKLLLVQVLEGRPHRVCRHPYDGDPASYLLVISHENGQHHCDMSLKVTDFMLLTTKFEEFKERFVEPALRNLDMVVYPERMERLMPTYRRVAELMTSG